MTVLMFGWEFPPHISGGLGTACFGLTKSLMEENVSVLFVVPRAYGDEEIRVINASDIVVEVGTEKFVTGVAGEIARSSRIIHIPSSITPYLAREPVECVESVESVESWNWEFVTSVTKHDKATRGLRYRFTGKYGPSLMDEVQRYGEVASAIATQNTFDVIHAHDWLTYPAGIESKRVSGKPLIVHVHATEYDRAGEDNIDPHIVEIEKEGMLEAAMIVAVSQWTKDIIIDKYGIDESKVKVVHNGVLPADVADCSFLPKISEHVITFLGRVTHQKGPQYFIEAARKVLNYFPDVHFIMAGSGDLLPAMIDRVAQLRLSSRIHFTGFLKGKQIQQVWSITDVYVMPSVSEPFGITPLEAVQAGVPVIVSNQSGVAEVMDHFIKVDFWETDALADAIINVLKHKGLSESLKAHSKKELESLTWKRAAKKITQRYDELHSAP